ncbi:hypothetical protein [Elioraea sp.]|uniref:hypothetical protein n=1 Tax=Elioraea sp. TaxID=2185103 RepID=UPI003F718B34
MKRLFISSFGITFLAAGSALAQYSYSAPNPYAEQGGSFYPVTTTVVMLTPEVALERLRVRVPGEAGSPGQGILRFRNGGLHKAVTCGTIDAFYPNGASAALAGTSKMPVSSPDVAFMAWRPDGTLVMAEAAAEVEADARMQVQPENGGMASRITVDVTYRVTRTLTLDGVRQPEVTMKFTSARRGEAAAFTPYTAMHPVGFGVAPMGNSMNALPFARLACMASGALEKALLLDEATLTADQTCMLGLAPADSPTCPRLAARAEPRPAPARGGLGEMTAIAEQRPR